MPTPVARLYVITVDPDTGRSFFSTTWADWLDATGAINRTQGSGLLMGGYTYISTAAINDFILQRAQITKGTWKLGYVYYKGPSEAITTFKVDGVSVGTIDKYAAGATNNQFAEITGIALATTSRKDIEQVAATKNASSGNYYLTHHSVAMLRTGA